MSILMRLDLPTFDLPMNAYSGFVSFGHIETIGELSVNSAFFISISCSLLRCKGSKKIPKVLDVSDFMCTFASFFQNSASVREAFQPQI